jgi:translation initiation factor 2B subunit (eIF-2B alpha/beta/delta family)
VTTAASPPPDPGENAAALLASVGNDHRSGASGIAARAIDYLLALARSGADAAEIERRILALPGAQPAMAVLSHLAHHVLTTALAPGAEIGPAMAHAAAQFAAKESAATAAIARFAGRWIDEAHRVLTFSASGTVRSALAAAAAREHALGPAAPPVLCAESRPLLEGRDMARELAAAGLRVTLVIDAALRSLIRPGDLVLLGADRIGWDGWVNKIGTRSLIEGAAVAGVPVVVLAPTTRFIPEGVEGEPEGERGSDEVWKGAPAGIRVANPTFEPLTFLGVQRVICEEGALTPADAVVRALAVEFDPRIIAARLHGAGSR